MDINDIKHAVDLLVYLNDQVCGKLEAVHRMIGLLVGRSESTFFKKRKAMRTYVSEAKDDIEEVLKIIKKEERIEPLMAALSRSIHSELKADLRVLHDNLEEMQGILLILEKDISDFEKFMSNVHEHKRLSELVQNVERALQKSSYQELLVKEILEYAKLKWEENIKGKSSWLYHGTSVIFLPFIKKDGLGGEMPKSVSRAIKRIVAIYEKYPNLIKRQLGHAISMYDRTSGTVAISPRLDVLKAAAAPNLPAFLYELLDRNALENLANSEELTAQERKTVAVVLRYSNMLRRRNSIVLLFIKLDSEFLKSIGVPDYISDYNSFIGSYFKMFFFKLFKPMNKRKAVIDELFKNLVEPLIQYKGGSDFEIRIKSVKPQFIYLRVKAVGQEIVSILEWDEKMTPVFS